MNNTNNKNHGKSKPIEVTAAIKQSEKPDPRNDELDTSLDTVRNILFGAQIKETERKQHELQDKIETAVNVLRKETQQNFIAVAQDIDHAKDQLTDESTVRKEERTNTLKRFDEIHQQLQEMNKQMKASEEKIQNLIKSENDRLHSQMSQWKNDITRQMRQSDEQLQQDKTDRKALAKLFSHAADQLLKDSSES